MLSKEASVKVKVNASFKRFLCLLLVLLMFPLDALAVVVNTPPETVPLDRTNGAPRPLKWCVVTASMVH